MREVLLGLLENHTYNQIITELKAIMQERPKQRVLIRDDFGNHTDDSLCNDCSAFIFTKEAEGVLLDIHGKELGEDDWYNAYIPRNDKTLIDLLVTKGFDEVIKEVESYGCSLVEIPEGVDYYIVAHSTGEEVIW